MNTDFTLVNLIRRVNIQPPPKQNVPDAPPMVKYPYYNADLNEMISDEVEDDIVTGVLRMEYNDLQLLNDDIKTKRALNPAYARTREFTLRCKAGIWRANQLKQAGKFGPAPSFVEAAAWFMGGWLLADEFWDRQGL